MHEHVDDGGICQECGQDVPTEPQAETVPDPWTSVPPQRASQEKEGPHA